MIVTSHGSITSRYQAKLALTVTVDAFGAFDNAPVLLARYYPHYRSRIPEDSWLGEREERNYARGG